MSQQTQKSAQTSSHTTTTTSVTTAPMMTLDVDSVNYNESYNVISGSFVQLLRGLKQMTSRLTDDSDNDEYKKVLYPQLRSLSSEVMEQMSELLKTYNESDVKVRQSFLGGYAGRVSRNNFGKYPFVKGVNPHTKYMYANFGYYIKLFKNRLERVVKREMPTSYKDDNKLQNSFNTLKVECSNCLNWLDTHVTNEWTRIVSEARSASGYVPPVPTTNTSRGNVPENQSENQEQRRSGFVKVRGNSNRGGNYGSSNGGRGRGGYNGGSRGSYGGRGRGGYNGGSRGGYRGNKSHEN
jgi:uncharacterized membrane protein YgcG